MSVIGLSFVAALFVALSLSLPSVFPGPMAVAMPLLLVVGGALGFFILVV